MKNKFIISSLAMFAMAFAFTASAATAQDMGTTTLKKGSTGMYSKALQMNLNACAGQSLVEDGVFGSGTLAGVKAFQVSKALSADGLVGPMTKAALVAHCAGTTTTTTTTTSTVTSGAEGILTSVNKLGSYNSTKIMEGDKDKVVYGFEVTARDADQKIDGLVVSFQNTPAGLSNAKFIRYASDVSVWLDGKEIGRKSVSSYSDDANDVYVYRFTGMNGTVARDAKGQILIAVSGNTSIDSTDASAEAWKVNVGTSVSGTANFVSAVSPNGRYRDYGSAIAQSTMDFQKAGTVSSDQKFKVTTASSNPLAQTVQVSNTSDTNDVLLAAFDAKAENAAMKVQRVPVVVATTIGLADGVTPNVEAAVKSVKLYANGTLLATESIPTAGAGTASATFTFGNSTKLNYAIASNATVKFEVKVDLNDIENTGISSTDLDSGDKVKASVDSATMTVELDNAMGDTVSNRTGNVTGADMSLLSTGALVTMGTATTTFSSETFSMAGNQRATYMIPVTVKAFDDTIYVGQSVQTALAGAIAGTNAFSFTLNDSTAPATQVTTVGGATITPTITSSAPANTAGTGWMISSGATQTFNIKIEVTGASAVAKIGRAHV